MSGLYLNSINKNLIDCIGNAKFNTFKLQYNTELLLEYFLKTNNLEVYPNKVSCFINGIINLFAIRSSGWICNILVNQLIFKYL